MVMCDGRNFIMKTELGARALTELQSTKAPKRRTITELSDIHQNYSTIDNDVDKIGNLVSILTLNEKKFLE